LDFVGAQGSQGIQGTQGIQGSEGTQGISGFVGGQGTQGIQGFQGTQGTQGIQGLIGEGAQGTQGIQGIQGISVEITIQNDETTDETYYVGYSTQTSGTVSQLNIAENKLTFNPSSGTLSATIFTSLSDETQKTNIRPIENALDLVRKMNGVKYDWKDDHNQSSIGVIAQEIGKDNYHK
jgi:ABC-type sugar transport system ATPase subunit